MPTKLESHLESTFRPVLTKPHHSLIITSLNQSSLRTALDWLTERLSTHSGDNLRISPDGATIKIEQVRPLYRLAHRRGQAKQRRVIVIESAELMSKPAQNALLKLLEEPPAGVVFLLGAAELSSLAPTILSRSQVIELPRLSRQDFNKLSNQSWDELERERRYLLSQGDLLLAENIESVQSTVEESKRLLSAPVSDLLAELNKTNPTKEQVSAWINGLILIAQSALETAKTQQSLQAWLKRSEAIIYAKNCLKANTGHKLTLNWLLLELRS